MKLKEVTNEMKNQIIEMYVGDLMSLQKISKNFNSSPLTIRNILVENNIEIRDCKIATAIKNNQDRFTNRKYHLNYNYFDNLNSYNSYVLGFIMADGGVYNGRLKIQLQESDYKMLEYIKKQLEYTGEISYVINKIKEKEYKTCKLSISSIDLCEKLKEYGIIENKSLIVKFPKNIPNEYEIDFIKGYFDGNGFTKSGKYLRCGFCSGSKEMMHDINKILQKYGLSNRTIHKKRGFNTYTIEYSSKECKIIYDLFYIKSNTFSLSRKKNVFESHLF